MARNGLRMMAALDAFSGMVKESDEMFLDNDREEMRRWMGRWSEGEEMAWNGLNLMVSSGGFWMLVEERKTGEMAVR